MQAVGVVEGRCESFSELAEAELTVCCGLSHVIDITRTVETSQEVVFVYILLRHICSSTDLSR